MLLTITLERDSATDLGYLLHKHPEKLQTFALNFGKAHVFYPEATDERCTVALLLEVDPIDLVRGRGPSGDGGLLQQYVNDRPYVASSFMSVAIAQVFGSALGGRSRERPELAELELPLVARLPVLPARRGGEAFLRRLFEPLGYQITAERLTLDVQFPEWGESSYYRVELRHRVRVADLLTHLYVLIPVLDNDKHYWVGDDEVKKLLRHGGNWLSSHPERERIAERYLKHQTRLVRSALSQLRDEMVDTEEPIEIEDDIEEPLRLHDIRLQKVQTVLRSLGAKRVLDLGCGEGRLLKLLLDDPSFTEIVGVDVSPKSLDIAADRLRLERMLETQRSRIKLMHGSLMYRDDRLAGFDAAACVEVIEHFDPPRLTAFERSVFEFAKPRAVVITTPNIEYNVRFGEMHGQRLRHRDHRFEWTRAEFTAWANSICDRFGYRVAFDSVGNVDPEVGPITQMAIFLIR